VGEHRPVFYYDINSPYAYLAAERVNHVLPVVPEWQPISFGHLLAATGRRPWSFDEATREPGKAEIERRAAERGLPPLRWPPGWPVESYSLAPMRAATFAKQSGRAVAFSLAAFRQKFAGGKALVDPDEILIAAAACELHPRAVLKGIESRSVKDELKRTTDEALERGVVGVPSVRTGDEIFWGDDRLEDAAAALS
jgi:2-hydroxychromene-2-carboxylate isomerase